MEYAKQINKKLIKTMLCNSFSFRESFHDVKLCFENCTATIEISFHVSPQMEKLQQIQTV